MFEKSSITQAVNSIYKTLQNRIIKNYNIDDVNESYLIADNLLAIHGLDKEHFNIISVIEKLIEGKINNNSIDDNSNKGEKTIKGILKEASNPIDKIIGYRYLYRKISDIYGKKEAKYLSSLMYDYTIALSDSTNILVPYSYYKHTPIFVRINGKEMYLSFEKLFNMFSKDKESFSDREQINCDKIKLKYNLLPAFINKQKPNINFSEPINGIERDVLIEVWDNNDWIKITHITKHKKDTNMILYQIASGNYAFVTENHPVFMEDGTEKYAKDLKLGDNVLVENNIPYIKEEINVDPKLAYFFGFLYGDGNSEGYKIDEQFYPNESNYIKFTAGGNRISLYQNDIDNSHIYKICKELFPDANFFKTSDKSNKQINFQSHWINRIMTEYFGNGYKDNSFTKSLPVNFMSWKQESKEAFLAGLIDSDGSIFKSDGKVSLRMMSYGIINGLYDAFKNILPIINIRIDEHSGYDGFIFEVSFKITETILNYSDKYQQLDNSIIEKALTYQEQFSNKNYNDNSISKIFIIKDEEIKSHFLKENLEYVFDITTESGSFYANGMKQHNCWSFDSSKLVTIGKPFGQLPSSPVKRFDSYVSLANEVIHQMSNHLAGAISIGTFFLDIGHLLLLNENKTIEDLKNEQYRKYIKNQYQRFIHGVNSLSRSGGAESPFSNISLLDSVKLKKMISEEYNWYFMLEDGTLPYEVDYIVNFIIELQNIYMEFFDKGDPLNDGMPYRFPISTLNISKKKNKDDKWVIEDKNFLKRVCKKDIYRYNMFVSEGNKFASCCRLLSDIEIIELASQANSFGAGGSISIGSHRVVTLNIMRLALIAESVEHFYSLVGDMITNIKKILFAHKQLIKDSSELQHFIKIGWINLNRMFSTVGLIGYVEATETLMKKFGVQKEFIYEMFHEINSFVNSNNENFKGCTFNIEQIPAESMAHRLARADKILFGEENVPYNIYANQIIPLWKKATIKERLEADGKCNKALTGGGIVHINTGEHITPLQAEMLVDLAVENNCEHFAITGTFCKCDDNHVIIGNKNNCAKCGKPIKQKIARTVGFFVDVDDMSSYKKEFDHDLRIEFTNGDFDIKGT